MSKKHYDTSSVENELRGASSFFKPNTPTPAPPSADEHVVTDSPAPPKDGAEPKAARTTKTPAPIKSAAPARDQLSAPPDARSSVRPVGRTPVRSVSRYAFEFYQDQIAELKDRSLHERIQGGSGNMSQMVRQAIDEYLSNHPRAEES